MIRLDFSKGNLYAHQQLVEIFAKSLTRWSELVFESYEYKNMSVKNNARTLGEVDVVMNFNSGLYLFEIKTNVDLKNAIQRLKNHQKHINDVLAGLPRVATGNVLSVEYFAIIYDLYLVFRVNVVRGTAEEIGDIDTFLNSFDKMGKV